MQEDTGRRVWKQRWGPVFQEGGPWRPVEPFERTGASDSKAELPTGIPPSALRNPKQYYDHVGNDMLAGGTPLRFGGQWDIVSQKVTPWQDPNKKPNVVKKGPHDCYCDIGCAPWDISPPPRLDVQSHIEFTAHAPSHRREPYLVARGCATRRYNCWSMAGKARTENHGLMGVFEREFWSNTPGELALVWDFKGEGNKQADKKEGPATASKGK